MSYQIVDRPEAPKLPPRGSWKRKMVKATSKKKKTVRAKLKPISKLKKELWELCKQLIRLTYGNSCYTCNAENLSGSNWQTGHFIARSICGLYLRYDLRNLRPQCIRCNVRLSGNGAIFYRNMVEREGQDYVDDIFADKKRDQKETRQFFAEKIELYQQTVDKLTQQT